MLWAETKPLLDARTDFGAMSPVIVVASFIFVSAESISALLGEMVITIRYAIKRTRIRTRSIYPVTSSHDFALHRPNEITGGRAITSHNFASAFLSG